METPFPLPGALRSPTLCGVVWWIWGDGTNRPKGLFRALADGTGFTGVDTGSDFNWFGPRVDDTAVYYFHAGALLKRLK